MKYGLDIPISNEFSNPETLVEVAIEAEEAGWDGFFLWDTLSDSKGKNVPFLDPWIALSAIASHTHKIKLGLLVTPLARRRPWKVAKELVTLDHLSNGRMIFGVGLGFAENDFIPFGETFDPRERAEKLDEGLEIVTKCLTGEKFSFEGKHYNLQNVQILPKPVQDKIPIWTGGFWPNKKPMRRAARYDGIYLGVVGGEDKMNPQILTDAIDYISKHRESMDNFDVAIYGNSSIDKNETISIINSFEGNTWWIEGNDKPYQEYRKKIVLGPRY